MATVQATLCAPEVMLVARSKKAPPRSHPTNAMFVEVAMLNDQPSFLILKVCANQSQTNKEMMAVAIL